jgi:uncharacterized protein (DUF2235 family)
MDQPLAQEIRRREGPTNPDSKTDYQFPRRLAVCLDGTWNQRDSGTNIYHLSNLILEGKIESAATAPTDAAPEGEAAQTWVQMVYYDEGVGTGLLDSVTGGAFGIGLSENVREAYDWLVERYRDGDHVYIFGFSRGSFTARSLVGMIAKCGLLYRGAPLPPSELWKGYQKMAPYPPAQGPDGKAIPPKKWWQPFGPPKPGPFRPLKYLKEEAGHSYKDLILDGEQTETEKLLCRWSRRIPIQCLAVFDTVGTFGIEALAIPWLRERRAQFHDTQLTSLIQHGFHALAIDEHRGNFSHIPWHRATELDTPEKKKVTDSYGEIEQRWFIGAHSNIGGSYDDDTLSQHPLAWFIKECKDLNLVFKPDAPKVAAEMKLEDCIPLWPLRNKTAAARKPGHICDSYAEFAKGIWRHLIRAKRNYRRIEPPAEFQNGKEVKSLNEALDPSVLQLLALNAAAPGDPGNYNPPNLYEYRKRKSEDLRAKKGQGAPKPSDLLAYPDPPLNAPPHIHLGATRARVWFGFWLAGIASSGVLLACLIAGWRWHRLDFVLPVVLLGVAWFADCGESYLNHKQALEPDDAETEKRDGLLDLLLNVRLIAIGAFALGVGFFIWILIRFSLFPLPLSEALWLLAFCLMMAHFNASKMWAAQPMHEADFGSILALQKANTPKKVSDLIKRWMQLGPEASDAYHSPDPHRLLPIHRTIWRDMIGFIPAYSIAFFAGLWMTLSLLFCWRSHAWSSEPILGLLSSCWSCWLPALLIVAMGALADYIEDAIHLRYLRDHNEPPTKTLVRAGRAATIIKTGACLLGMAGLSIAILLLGLLQIYRALIHAFPSLACKCLLEHLPASHSSIPAILSIISAIAALVLAYFTVRAFLMREKKMPS